MSSPAMGSPRRMPSDVDLGRAPTAISSYSAVLPGSVEEAPPPLMTSASVASDYFARELSAHDKNHNSMADTVVIIHDACYGHRFSRPKTTKSMLSMIVERPERISACALGVSAAYVRLGSRHKGGENAPRPDKLLPPGAPFNIRKSSRSIPITSPPVVAVHGKKWMDELHVMCESAGTRLATGMKELARTEEANGSAGQAEKPTFHEGDLYLCSESLNALQGAAGGVCDAVDAIFDSSPTAPHRAFVAVRPPGHHCSSDWPSGFCWINNVHIAIEYAAQTYGLTHAAILDIDLHHGDGSQDITWERNAKSAAMAKNAPFSKKTSIGYYSMHDINSYPCEYGDKEKVQNASLCIDNAHGQSIWNVHLQPWSTMDEFWALYETKYLVLLQKARTFLKAHTARIRATPKQVPAKAAIFISAGFDASEWEGAGMQRHAVNVPTEFYARFTNDVVKLAQEEGTAVEGRVISVLEGGYSDRALTSGVLSHLSGLCQHQPSDAATDDMISAIQKMDIAALGIEKAPAIPAHVRKANDYNIDWWNASNLTALENYITPPPPPPAPKGRQRTAMPTYATPTESFTNKVVDPENFKRSMSGTLRTIPFASSKPAQPVPEVDWIVATHELSKLLIPSDRQTKSCKPEELAPPRVKKERLSEPPTVPIDNGRVTRGRKAKTPPTEAGTSAPSMDDIVDSMRRQTISDLPLSTNGTGAFAPESLHVPALEPLPAPAPRRSTRRSSQMFHEAAPMGPPTVTTRPSSQPPAAPQPTRRPARAPPPAFKPAPAPAVKRVTSSSATTAASRARTPTEYSHTGRPAAVGPKRITLKLGSREESERKTQEKLDVVKREQQAARPKPTRVVSSKATVAKPGDMGPPPPYITKDLQSREAGIPEVAVQLPTPDNVSIAGPPSTVSADNEQRLPADVKHEEAPDSEVFEDTHPTSPPMFTPTFMNSFQSPASTQVNSATNTGPPSLETTRTSFPSAGGAEVQDVQTKVPEQETGRDLPQESGKQMEQEKNEEVQYEFRPQPPPHKQSDRQGEINEMIKSSMLSHPKMVVSDGVSGGAQGQSQSRHLPTFSATGRIPFAPSAKAEPTSHSQPNQGLGITSPTKLGANEHKNEPSSSATSDTSISSIPLSGVSDNLDGHSASPDTTPRPTPKPQHLEDEDMMDAWEVPETPSPKR